MARIIYPSTIEWEGSAVFQRPQQLMKAFAQAGHESIFLEPGDWIGHERREQGVKVYRGHGPLPPSEEFSVLWVTLPHYFDLKNFIR